MLRETVYTNARVVTRDAVFNGSVRAVDGRIASIDEGPTQLSAAIDIEGDFLIPGLIDLHTDTLEHHLEPRPGVRWPVMAALMMHDRQIAAAGITTVFDSLCVGDFDNGTVGRRDALVNSLEALERAQSDGLLKADHLFHLRCEVTSVAIVESFLMFVDDPLVRLVSVMDHTPGQRQWSNLDKWRQFNSRRNVSRAELNVILETRQRNQARYAGANRAEVVRLSKERGLPLASHDDTTPEHVEEAIADGVTISEFPTTEDAARIARENKLHVVMGSPNVVMGGSHSGNVSAGALAEAGLVDGLASDYVPLSLLHAAFLFHEDLDIALPQAIATVTSNPAEMVGLDDRGTIDIGKRADLVWVKSYEHAPVCRGVWRAGEHVA